MTSRLYGTDNAKFLERFRYIIVASQLLNIQSFHGQVSRGHLREVPALPPDTPQLSAFTLAGAGATAFFAFAVALVVHWTRAGINSISGVGRLTASVVSLTLFAAISYAYMRRQWLLYLRQQSLTETSEFIIIAQDFDNTTAGALALVQEVELVSRGYRMYAFISVPQ